MLLITFKIGDAQFVKP